MIPFIISLEFELYRSPAISQKNYCHLNEISNLIENGENVKGLIKSILKALLNKFIVLGYNLMSALLSAEGWSHFVKPLILRWQ